MSILTSLTKDALKDSEFIVSKAIKSTDHIPKRILISKTSREIETAFRPLKTFSIGEKQKSILSELVRSKVPDAVFELPETDMVFGFASRMENIAPKIQVSSGLLSRLRPKQQEAIVLHEVGHLLNPDLLGSSSRDLSHLSEYVSDSFAASEQRTPRHMQAALRKLSTLNPLSQLTTESHPANLDRILSLSRQVDPSTKKVLSISEHLGNQMPAYKREQELIRTTKRADPFLEKSAYHRSMLKDAKSSNPQKLQAVLNYQQRVTDTTALRSSIPLSKQERQATYEELKYSRRPHTRGITAGFDNLGMAQAITSGRSRTSLTKAAINSMHG